MLEPVKKNLTGGKGGYRLNKHPINGVRGHNKKLPAKVYPSRYAFSIFVLAPSAHGALGFGGFIYPPSKIRFPFLAPWGAEFNDALLRNFKIPATHISPKKLSGKQLYVANSIIDLKLF